MVTENDIIALKARLAELEDRLKCIYRHLNIEFLENNSDPISPPLIQAALREGNKIAAIKIYREMTGVGLAEAKQAIDRAEQFIK